MYYIDSHSFGSEVVTNEMVSECFYYNITPKLEEFNNYQFIKWPEAECSLCFTSVLFSLVCW